jgi:hypothetical protein
MFKKIKIVPKVYVQKKEIVPGDNFLYAMKKTALGGLFVIKYPVMQVLLQSGHILVLPFPCRS